MGCDLKVLARVKARYGFQSTQPEWAATVNALVALAAQGHFNPRSPSGLRHGHGHIYGKLSANFNPRSPSGLRRRISEIIRSTTYKFQSTQPEWAATGVVACKIVQNRISIHAARVGCDTAPLVVPMVIKHFNPRSPSGLRLPIVLHDLVFENFNPRSPSGLRR